MFKVNCGKVYLLFLLLNCLAIGESSAQEVDAFVQVSMSPSKVVVKQPIKVKVTVLTATWFTEPLDFQNAQVSNAFILPFARTQSGIHHVNGKQYAGLEFFFLVFPYQEGEYHFPALEIKTSTPAVNDYIGKPVTLVSKARKFKVEPVPGGSKAPSLVAKNLYLSQEWSKDLSKVQVGDVVIRTVYLNAKGTLPSFIPALEFNENEFTSIYPKKVSLEDRRDYKDANGLRIERYAYLFEKEGQFTISPVEVSWWNPYLKRKYTKSLDAIDLDVEENPNLGIVSSLRDSLNQVSGMAVDVEIQSKNWRDYVPLILNYGRYLVLAALFVYLILKSYLYLRIKRQWYLKSEPYYYHLFKKKKDLASLYRWYDQYRIERNFEPNIKSVFPELDLDDQDWNKLIDQLNRIRKKNLLEVESGVYSINPSV